MITLENPALLRTQAYINGDWVEADSGKKFEVLNPATQKIITQVADLEAFETQKAITAAAEAFPLWKEKTAGERSKILRRWYELQLENITDLAKILTSEQGKPFAEAKGEILYGASFVEWFAEEAKRIYGDTIPAHQADKRIIVLKQPIGVVAAITPWNFPNAMITRKIAPALAAGCTVVVKPSELTPLSALALAQLAQQAGFPKGVLNVVVGQNADAIGKELTYSPLVRKFSFTGSTIIGKKLAQQCTSTLKKVSLELGGNAPFIVLDDADIDQAVGGAINSKYRNAGQTCVSANRIYVQDAVYEEFTKKFTKKVAQQNVGNGMDEGIKIGALISSQALEKAQNLVRDAVQKGGKILMGGKPHSLGGTFYEPTVIAEATADMHLTHQEIFAPIAPIYRFQTDEQVIKLANNTPYGLASYFYGQNLARSGKLPKPSNTVWWASIRA